MAEYKQTVPAPSDCRARWIDYTSIKSKPNNAFAWAWLLLWLYSGAVLRKCRPRCSIKTNLNCQKCRSGTGSKGKRSNRATGWSLSSPKTAARCDFINKVQPCVLKSRVVETPLDMGQKRMLLQSTSVYSFSSLRVDPMWPVYYYSSHDTVTTTVSRCEAVCEMSSCRDEDIQS